MTGCAWFRSRPPIEPRIGATQEGIASWYGPRFHGKRTASGEVFDQFDLTAAHPSLPLGTRVLVTNLKTGQAAEVRINDRGPFVDGRVIDLSYAAGRVVGVVGPGTAPVRLVVLGWEEPRRAADRYVVQLGMFSDRRKAQRLLRELHRKSYVAYVVPARFGNVTYYRVRMRVRGDHESARRTAQALAQAGLNPLVVAEGDGP